MLVIRFYAYLSKLILKRTGKEDNWNVAVIFLQAKAKTVLTGKEIKCYFHFLYLRDQKRKRLKEEDNLQDKSDQSMEDIDISKNSESRGTIPNTQSN